MTIQNQTSSVTHNGNGLTTEWPYTFEIPDADSLRVGLFDIATNVLTPINDTDFTVTGLGTPTGGEVTYPLVGAPISAAKRLVIWREVPLTQEMDVTNQSPYYPEVLEDQLDLIVMMIQQLQGESDRAIKVTLGSNLTPDEFIEQLQQGAADAAASATEAEQWSLLAQKWAENPEDVEVVTGQYSALHWAAKAADIVATIALPAVPVALSYLRRNAGNTAYEARTPAQVAEDISALRYDAAHGLTLAQQGQARANIGADVLGGFRNKIINGDFDIWQRGTSLVAGTGSRFTADRWRVSSTGSTMAVARTAFSPGITEAFGDFRFGAQITIASSAGTGNFAFLAQKIESVRTFAGKKVTISLAGYADAAKNIAIELIQNFGTGGSPSTFVSVPAGLFAMTTALGKKTLTVDVPSIAGKTIGSNGDDSLELFIWFDAGSSFNARASNLGQQSGVFTLSHISIVEGDATAETDPFSPRHIQQELALCQRYARPIGRGCIGWSTGSNVTVFGRYEPMRTIPSISGVIGSGSNGLIVIGAAFVTFTGFGSANPIGDDGFYINLTGSGVSAGVMTIGANNMAFLDAEL